MSYIYLASPYSHPEANVRRDRFLSVEDLTVWLLRKRIWVYSPIVYCHAMAERHSLPTNIAFWLDYNTAMISSSAQFWIFAIDGWQESSGISKEIDVAASYGLIPKFIVPNPGNIGYVYDQLPNFDIEGSRQ